MKLFIGSLQLGLLYGILALGIYISFRILSNCVTGMRRNLTFTASGHKTSHYCNAGADRY